ncbi:hypothetical protein HU200_018500 [Digitaria exilis]|uniref:Uncharacterized protein n=1 Tax=Digitaria exilis TaxID=1010633 RepID=A0A835KE03_9POAL|nr:hypothetical protein HU200_018500 [Digitaria exilis]
MAALLHQAALPATTKPPHPRALNPTPTLSPPLLSTRRRGATIRSAATDSSSIGATGAAPSSEKKTTRKEKLHERRRQQDLQNRQQQLLMMEESSSSLAKSNSRSSGSKSEAKGGGGNEVDDEEVPQPVFDRILRRILFFVGVPMASGVSLLKGYDALKREQGVDVPAWLPLLTILLAFGTSALGIAFGTLSASWDPDREGSLLGFDEVTANWPVLWKDEIEKKAKQRKK